MDRETIERLYRAYFTRVYRYALKLCGDQHTAEDVAAEAFFRAMTHLDGFRAASSPGTWLCAIARRVWLTRLRKEHRETPADPLPDAAVPDGLNERLAADEILLRVDALPPGMRDVFLMRADGGMSFREIGRLLGHTENWACVTYHRARGRLKKEWEEEP